MKYLRARKSRMKLTASATCPESCKHLANLKKDIPVSSVVMAMKAGKCGPVSIGKTI